MYILGINAYHGDSSACIIKDGEFIAAAEEERFRRIKHWAGFPSEAINYCLEEAGISPIEIRMSVYPAIQARIYIEKFCSPCRNVRGFL